MRDWITEEECEKFLKEFREKEGLKCSECGGTKHTWNENTKRWTCTNCGHLTRLTSDTVMHGTKLPLLYWFKTINMLVQNPKISTRQIQLALGHKRYQPIWEMVHKLKGVGTGEKTLTNILSLTVPPLDSDLEIVEIETPLTFSSVLENGVLSKSKFKHKNY